MRTADVSGPLPAERRSRLDLIDVATGETRVLASGDDVSFGGGRFSPDGERIVCLRDTDSNYDRVGATGLWFINAGTGDGRPLAAELDRWPTEVAWSPDGASVYFVADDDGRAPVFRVDVESDVVTTLTASGSHSCIQVARDGSAVYALRSGWDHPPRPVRIDPSAIEQEPVLLRAPGLVELLPGRLERIKATAGDGARNPLVAGVAGPGERRVTGAARVVGHGGPLGSWKRVVVAMVPVAARGPGLRSASSGPGVLHRLRPRLRPAGLGSVGRESLHRPHVGRRRRINSPRSRRNAYGGDGRLLRRLHGQLDRHPTPAASAPSSLTRRSGISTGSPVPLTRRTTGNVSSATRSPALSATTPTHRSDSPMPSVLRCW